MWVYPVQAIVSAVVDNCFSSQVIWCSHYSGAPLPSVHSSVYTINICTCPLPIYNILYITILSSKVRTHTAMHNFYMLVNLMVNSLWTVIIHMITHTHITAQQKRYIIEHVVKANYIYSKTTFPRAFITHNADYCYD